MKKITVWAMLTAAMLTFAVSSCSSAKKAAETPAVMTWTTFYAPVTVDIDQPMSLAVSGRATMVNGKYIHLSMRLLGMEMAVMYVDADSAYILDKYHKYMFAESLPKLLGDKYKNLKIGDLQKILLGQQNIPANNMVTVTPSGYVNTPAGQVATRMSISAQTPRMDVAGGWEWSQYEAKWNEPNRGVDFKVPTNYKRIDLANLNDVLRNLSL